MSAISSGKSSILVNASPDMEVGFGVKNNHERNARADRNACRGRAAANLDAADWCAADPVRVGQCHRWKCASLVYETFGEIADPVLVFQTPRFG
jgi:hypothetical protein